MENNPIYAVTGLFDTPDEIIKATKAISDKGYVRYDVNTSYPLHGMFKAMRLKPSTLGYFALVFGLTGTFTALLLMWYTSTFDYPLVIGGKPFFQLPAFIPITFEVTVLLASIGTVVTMLFIFFKLPNNSHPLHDTDYMKSVSGDKYGAYIESSDPKFNENDVKAFLSSLGAKEITTIYWDKDQLASKPDIFQPKFLAFLAGVAIVFAFIFYFFLNKVPFLPPFNWMFNQFKLNTQTSSTLFSDGFGMRMPVEGTVARGTVSYPYVGMGDTAAKQLSNPLDYNEKNLNMGKANFNTFCSPCHGYLAKGDGRLRGQFPNPPSLHSEKVRNWTDGQIYHVITVGQNVMPSYSKLITSQERWQVILYIRALQRALNAKEEDLQ